MSKQTAGDLMAALDAAGNPLDAVFLTRFFKCGPGEYGEGDEFIGVRVPTTRKIVKSFETLPLSEVLDAIASPVHEHRLAAVLIMVRQFIAAGKARSLSNANRKNLHEAYLEAVYAGHVNNWDIVDSSAEYLIGEYLRIQELGGPGLIDELIMSSKLWERRVGVISTFAFTKSGDPGPLLRIAPKLLEDREDLIHKATGWMLREMGKRDTSGLDHLHGFLDTFAAQMPRTMLRYAIEHFTAEERYAYRQLR